MEKTFTVIIDRLTEHPIYYLGMHIFVAPSSQIIPSVRKLPVIIAMCSHSVIKMLGCLRERTCFVAFSEYQNYFLRELFPRVGPV